MNKGFLDRLIDICSKAEAELTSQAKTTNEASILEQAAASKAMEVENEFKSHGEAQGRMTETGSLRNDFVGYGAYGHPHTFRVRTAAASGDEPLSPFNISKWFKPEPKTPEEALARAREDNDELIERNRELKSENAELREFIETAKDLMGDYVRLMEGR